jgi:hypothetical protein
MKPRGESFLPERPFPVLLNGWKHHAGILRHQIALAAAGGDAGLEDLAAQLVVVGTALMDLYTGQLSPAEIADRVVAALKVDDRLSLDAYGAWVQANGGYQVLSFPEDDSRWVLRLSDEAGRYVHVHPGRWSPATLRVRANVLKTAVMVLAHAAVHGGGPLDVARMNRVRQRYLGLSPVGALAGEQGLRGVIDVLRASR